jgi:Icc-related predicted phosphoesterase
MGEGELRGAAGGVRILAEAGVRVLDGEAFEIQGVGIAGGKGFSGGFGRATLGAWGEPATKRYVQEAIDEATVRQPPIGSTAQRRNG